MEQDDATLPKAVAQEIAQLRQQIQSRDQLVTQLSSELFRMVKTYPPALPSSVSGDTHPQNLSNHNPVKNLAISPQPTNKTEQSSLHNNLKNLEEQIEFYQTQIDKRDVEITRLQKSCQSLSERNQLLEHIVQELPEMYRQKFADRLDLVKSKVQTLQTENRRLSTELQQVNAQLPESRGAAKRLALPAKPNSMIPNQAPTSKAN